MSAYPDTSLPLDPPTAPAVVSEPRPLYWSVRREIWENRSVYIAPLVVAGIVLFVCLISTAVGVAKGRRSGPGADPAKQYSAVRKTFQMAPAPIMMTTILVGFFYCLDALYGERRDRSILFWKSLPVSDRTAVLSKASIPIVVLPAIAYALSVVVQLVLLFESTILLTLSGESPVLVWGQLRFFEGLVIMFYGLAAHALWFTPIYGWLLLVSGWAKRAPVLWALLPPLVISAIERMAFNTWYFMKMLQYRMTGAMFEAFALPKGSHNVSRFTQLDPAKFLSAPGLWIGLIFGAACLLAAIRMRRAREPI